ncbi:cytochrome c oxidase subunit II [Geomesophilobacter sediminis]|uniref:Cytochrome c oxidase subunit 2 n=1 Tax=Geomesophilobacter sediminis TaxID=2798584 RepID=A0A8J7IQH1_9BACT|nr:cytochrome c oxidase subunit II [Geomesophilobacter sediminis]MBJ6726138.1 cytochrome c oxidase subunit II [Geomesophilobacter sediminis]
MTTNQAIDPVFVFILGACLVLLIGITAAMITFVIRYRRSRAPEPTSQVEGSFWLEIVWTALPTVLVLVMFYYGWSGYLALRRVPPGALKVNATARMWSWNFRYENGKSSNKLMVPVGKPVVVLLESQDVIHGFYVPAFRVKRDVVPGMKNHVWFMAPKAGSFDLFCSQYCGKGHSAMITTIEAVPEAQFNHWLNEEKEEGKEKGHKLDGAKIAQEKGCLGCHSLDGTTGAGPSFKGIYGTKVKVTRDGKPMTVTVDDAYLRESITAPGAAIVDGFQPIMPTFGDLTPDEVGALVEYIEHVK